MAREEGEEEGRTFDPYNDVLVKLPLETQRVLLSILAHNDLHNPSTSRKVKNVCNRMKWTLESMGLVADFYAYALIYWATQQSPEALVSALDAIPSPKAKDLFSQGGDPRFN
jgi:hypothetical protein